jgi:hypothetical protein
MVQASLAAVLKMPPATDCWCFGSEDITYIYVV